MRCTRNTRNIENTVFALDFPPIDHIFNDYIICMAPEEWYDCLTCHKKCHVIFCPTHQQQNRFRPGWLSLLLVYSVTIAKVVSQSFCQSSFPPLKNNSDSSSTTPSSKANLFALVFASNSNLNDQGLQPHHFPLQNSLCHPLSSPHEKSAKPFSSLTPPNPKALMEFQQ